MRVLEQADAPLTVEIPTSVIFHPDLTAIDFRVYAVLVYFNVCGLDRPSQGGIAELAHIHRNSVPGSLDRLEGAGKVLVDDSATPHAIHLVA